MLAISFKPFRLVLFKPSLGAVQISLATVQSLVIDPDSFSFALPSLHFSELCLDLRHFVFFAG